MRKKGYFQIILMDVDFSKDENKKYQDLVFGKLKIRESKLKKGFNDIIFKSKNGILRKKRKWVI